MAVACYCRCSTEEQDISLQRTAIEGWLDRNSINSGAIKWFDDSGCSGKSFIRPRFAAMLQSIERGEIDTVIFTRLDRISRNMVDGMSLLARWSQQSVRVVSVSQNIDVSGITGQIIAAVLLGFAQLERETIIERQKLGIAKAKALGKYHGRKPGTRKANAIRAKELYAKGLLPIEIATSLGISERTVFRYVKTIDEYEEEYG